MWSPDIAVAMVSAFATHAGHPDWLRIYLRFQWVANNLCCCPYSLSKMKFVKEVPDVGFPQPCSTSLATGLLVVFLSPQIRSEFTWGSRLVRIWQYAKRTVHWIYLVIQKSHLHERVSPFTESMSDTCLFVQTPNMTTSAKNDTEYVLLNWKPFGTMKQRVGCCRASTTEWGRVAETRLE